MSQDKVDEGKRGKEDAEAGTESKDIHEGASTITANEYAELKERFLRLAAEFDNYKKRTANEASIAKRMGTAELMKPLLNIVDEFELTLMAVGKSKDDGLAKGIEMLYSNFVDVLKSFGLKEVETKGFDPYKHEIILAREDDSKPGTILEIVKKGYMLDDKLLRPASVIVAKEREGKGGGKQEEANGKEEAEKKK
ncbi:MAG: nucleotide exchange factor GrpE [Candidatus Micrarchaeaceae archaeon]